MNKSSEHFRITIIIVFCLSTCFFHPSLAANSKLYQELEYKVEVGDSQTYIYTKVFSFFSTTPYEFQITGVREEGGFVAITIREGTTITYTITSVPHSGIILGTRTYNGNITLQEESFGLFILRAVDNRSYWEEYCINYDTNNTGNPRLSISGNLIIQEYYLENQSLQTSQGIISANTTAVNKWNWKTGWPVYHLIRHYNSTTTLNEVEWELLGQNGTNENNNSNLIFGSFLFMTLMIAIVVIVIYQKKNK